MAAKPGHAAEIAKDFGSKLNWLMDTLRNGNPFRSADIGEVLYKLGKGQIPNLLTYAGDADQFVQAAVIGTLARFGKPSVKPAVALLKNDDQRVTGTAAAILKLIGEDAVKDLSQACNPSSETYSPQAANLLMEIDPEAIAKFTSFLAEGLGSDDQFKSSAAIKAFSAIGSPAVGELVGFLEDQNPYLQQNAAHALVSIGGDAVPELVAVLGGESQLIQQNSYHVLKQIGRTAIPVLLKAASESNSPVQVQNSRRLLDELGKTQSARRAWWPFGRQT